MKTILVIENDEPNRDILMKILEFEGFCVLGAEDGLVGVQRIKTHLPSLIICDVVMPRLDGYGVLDAVRRDPQTASIPFVFVSARAEWSEVRRGISLGADSYLTKPFTIAELIEVITLYLGEPTDLMQAHASCACDGKGGVEVVSSALKSLSNFSA